VELRRLQARLGTTTVFVTHDQNEAMALADQIVIMDGGEILQIDDPDGVYHCPSCLFVASFIGRPAMNLLKADAAMRSGDAVIALGGQTVPVPTSRADAAEVIVGVRPEHLRLTAPGEGALAARVMHAEYFGSHWIAEIETPAGTMKALVDKAVRPEEGDVVGAAVLSDHVVLFDAATQRLLPSAATQARQGSGHVRRRA
jgi:multiple sugar transport system ATP-binding protein